MVRGRRSVSAGLAQTGAGTVRAARHGRTRYLTVPDVARLAARASQGRARSCRRPRLDLRAADPTGPSTGHHGVRPRPADSDRFSRAVVRLAGDAVANAIEREFLERDRANFTTRLERTRRMQMIGSLASGIAHNFNNIIGAILGYSEMVEPQLTPGTKPATAYRRDPASCGARARSNRQHPHIRAAANARVRSGAGAQLIRGGGLAATRLAAFRRRTRRR